MPRLFLIHLGGQRGAVCCSVLQCVAMCCSVDARVCLPRIGLVPYSNARPRVVRCVDASIHTHHHTQTNTHTHAFLRFILPTVQPTHCPHARACACGRERVCGGSGVYSAAQSKPLSISRGAVHAKVCASVCVSADLSCP